MLLSHPAPGRRGPKRRQAAALQEVVLFPVRAVIAIINEIREAECYQSKSPDRLRISRTTRCIETADSPFGKRSRDSIGSDFRRWYTGGHRNQDSWPIQSKMGCRTHAL